MQLSWFHCLHAPHGPFPLDLEELGVDEEYRLHWLYRCAFAQVHATHMDLRALANSGVDQQSSGVQRKMAKLRSRLLEELDSFPPAVQRDVLLSYGYVELACDLLCDSLSPQDADDPAAELDLPAAREQRSRALLWCASVSGNDALVVRLLRDSHSGAAQLDTCFLLSCAMALHQRVQHGAPSAEQRAALDRLRTLFATRRATDAQRIAEDMVHSREQAQATIRRGRLNNSTYTLLAEVEAVRALSGKRRSPIDARSPSAASSSSSRGGRARNKQRGAGEGDDEDPTRMYMRVLALLAKAARVVSSAHDLCNGAPLSEARLADLAHFQASVGALPAAPGRGSLYRSPHPLGQGDALQLVLEGAVARRVGLLPAHRAYHTNPMVRGAGQARLPVGNCPLGAERALVRADRLLRLSLEYLLERIALCLRAVVQDEHTETSTQDAVRQLHVALQHHRLRQRAHAVLATLYGVCPTHLIGPVLCAEPQRQTDQALSRSRLRIVYMALTNCELNLPPQIRHHLYEHALDHWQHHLSDPTDVMHAFRTAAFLLSINQMVAFQELLRHAPGRSQPHSLLLDLQVFLGRRDLFEAAQTLGLYIQTFAYDMPTVYMVPLCEQLVTYIAPLLKCYPNASLPKQYITRYLHGLAQRTGRKPSDGFHVPDVLRVAQMDVSNLVKNFLTVMGCVIDSALENGSERNATSARELCVATFALIQYSPIFQRTDLKQLVLKIPFMDLYDGPVKKLLTSFQQSKADRMRQVNSNYSHLLSITDRRPSAALKPCAFVNENSLTESQEMRADIALAENAEWHRTAVREEVLCRTKRIFASVVLQRACRRANLLSDRARGTAQQSSSEGGLYGQAVMGRIVLSIARSSVSKAAAPQLRQKPSLSEVQAAQMVSDLQLAASFARQRLQFVSSISVARVGYCWERIHSLERMAVLLGAVLCGDHQKALALQESYTEIVVPAVAEPQSNESNGNGKGKDEVVAVPLISLSTVLEQALSLISTASVELFNLLGGADEVVAQETKRTALGVAEQFRRHQRKQRNREAAAAKQEQKARLRLLRRRG